MSTRKNDADVVLSKRALLFGRSAAEPLINPPWAHAIHEYCTQCGECARACPEQIIRIKANSTPSIDFNQGECTFCKACAQACPEPVFDLTRKPWQLTVSIGSHCFLEKKVYCRSCGDACAERALRFKPALGGNASIQIDSSLCSGCGACMASCPVNAVKLQALTNSLTQLTEAAFNA